MVSRSALLILALAVLAGTALAAGSLLGEQRTDQVRRDLTRILSEVYQRAQSHALVGAVARPEYGSPKIDLPMAAQSVGWRPNCQSEIIAEPVDPTEFPFALLIVPPNEVSDSGSIFTAYAIYAGIDPLASDALASPLPDWMTKPVGGYRDLELELEALVSRSTIEITALDCGGFGLSIIVGEPR